MVDADSREPISPLVFPGSLGAGSYNTQFAGLGSSTEANGRTVDPGTMADFDCPSYNADTRDFGFTTWRGGATPTGSGGCICHLVA
jgi:hypothetical protein